MAWIKNLLRSLVMAAVVVHCCSCSRQSFAQSEEKVPLSNDTLPASSVSGDQPDNAFIIVPQDITVKQYFPFLDSIVAAHDSLVNYPLSEHLLVLANPWIIDTLANTDYYRQKSRGIFIYDQRDMTVLHEGDTLRIPDDATAAEIQDRLSKTVIDVNIPEFRLRIIEGDTVKYIFPVRVGRNENKYLKTAKRTVSLQTPIGEGEIVRIERNPIFVNPVNGERYTTTQRDDDQYTMMPQIPWLEPSIDGRRLGSLIHPTTNPKTLGKAYSNGCVGTAEGDAWIIYYHSPVGTKVNFRYDLEVADEHGNIIELKDIYGIKKGRKQAGTTLLQGDEIIFQFAGYSPGVIGHDITGCH